MKIGGKRLDMPPEVVVPIIREGGEVFFKAGAVLDFKEFDTICPAPIPPMIQRKGESSPVPDFTDKKYIAASENYGRQRTNYMIVKSLSITEKLEWEKVKLNDPTTYDKYEEELREAGLNQIEIGRLITAVMEANGLDEAKIEAAKKRFLASKAAQA